VIVSVVVLMLLAVLSDCHSLIENMLWKVLQEETQVTRHPPQFIEAARHLVFQLATMRFPPAFITTFLQEQEALTKTLEHCAAISK
jgi:hypothetical protein